MFEVASCHTLSDKNEEGALGHLDLTIVPDLTALFPLLQPGQCTPSKVRVPNLQGREGLNPGFVGSLIGSFVLLSLGFVGLAQIVSMHNYN